MERRLKLNLLCFLFLKIDKFTKWFLIKSVIDVHLNEGDVVLRLRRENKIIMIELCSAVKCEQAAGLIKY